MTISKLSPSYRWYLATNIDIGPIISYNMIHIVEKRFVLLRFTSILHRISAIGGFCAVKCQNIQSDDELDTSLVLTLFFGIEVWLKVFSVEGESSGINSSSTSSKWCGFGIKNHEIAQPIIFRKTKT